MDDGRRISVATFTDAGWRALDGRGVAWEGNANLSRFFNELPKPAAPGLASVTYSRGWWKTTRAVQADEELFFYSYGRSFWG